MTLTIMRGIAVALGVSTVFGVAPIQAQETPRGQTVTERQRPDLDPLGVHAASFLVFPKFSLGESYNDNIFATTGNRKDDFITTLSPELRAQSDWNRHFLAFEARGDIGRYATNSSEDFEDATIGANGRVDIVRDAFVSGGATLNKFHEDRGSPDAVNGKFPTEYMVLSPTVGAANRWNRFSLRGDARFAAFTDSLHAKPRERDRHHIDNRVAAKQAEPEIVIHRDPPPLIKTADAQQRFSPHQRRRVRQPAGD